jgi:hypothetical protein
MATNIQPGSGTVLSSTVLGLPLWTAAAWFLVPLALVTWLATPGRRKRRKRK